MQSTETARLERIASRAPAVSIYRMEKGVSLWQWLCKKHLAERKADRWDDREVISPPHPLECEMCPRAS